MSPVLPISPAESRNLHIGGIVTLPGELRDWTLTVSHVWDDPYRLRGKWVHGRDGLGVWRTVRVDVTSQ